MKKEHLVFMMLLALATVFSACGSNDGEEESTGWRGNRGADSGKDYSERESEADANNLFALNLMHP